MATHKQFGPPPVPRTIPKSCLRLLGFLSAEEQVPFVKLAFNAEAVHVLGQGSFVGRLFTFIMSKGSWRPYTTRHSIWECFGLCLFKTCFSRKRQKNLKRTFTIFYGPTCLRMPLLGPKNAPLPGLNNNLTNGTCFKQIPPPPTPQIY